MAGVLLPRFWGFTGSLMPFVGVFFAEQDTKSLRQIIKLAFIWGALAVLPFTALGMLFAPQVAAVLGNPAAKDAVQIFSLSLPLSLVNNIILYIHLSGKRTAFANVLLVVKLFAGVVLFSLPLSLLFGLDGVWHGFWLAEALTFLTAVILSFAARRNNKDLSPVFLMDTSVEKSGAYKAFAVLPTPESVSACSEGITEFGETNGLSPKETMSIALALEELLVVINENSQPENTNVRMLIDKDIIILRLRCAGAAFNPVEYAKKRGGAGRKWRLSV
jgi:hypothetical protein